MADFELKSGPPMLRMLICQFVFQTIQNSLPVRKSIKGFLIGLVCTYLCFHDLKSFLAKPQANLYGMVGIDRQSNDTFINERLDLAISCLRSDSQNSTESLCETFNWREEQKARLNKSEIEQIRYVLVKNPKLRELYDKTEIFIRYEFEKTQLNPSQGERYLMTF